MFYHFINYGVNTIEVTFISGSCSVSINHKAGTSGTIDDALSAIRYFLVAHERSLTEKKVVNIRLVANNRGKDTLQVSADMRELQSKLRLTASSFKCRINIQSGLNLLG